MKRVVAPAALLAGLLLSACAHVDYVGRSYPPTTRVELFFDEADVTEPFEVMGQVSARGMDIISAEKLQKKIMKKAEEKGADAVVITGMERYKTGESTSYEETTKARKKGGTTTSGSSETSENNEKEIRAKFLKYKRGAVDAAERSPR